MNAKLNSSKIWIFSVILAAFADLSQANAQTPDDLSQNKMIAILAAQIQDLKMHIHKLEGSAVSEWVTYSPSLNSGGASGFIYSGRYRRVGSEIEIYLNIRGGAAASLGPQEIYLNYLPAGITVDAKKFLDNNGRNGGFAYGSAFIVESGGYAPATFELDSANLSRGRPLVVDKSLRVASPNLPGYSVNAFKRDDEFVTVRINLPVLEWSGAAIDFNKMTR